MNCFEFWMVMMFGRPGFIRQVGRMILPIEEIQEYYKKNLDDGVVVFKKDEIPIEDKGR